LKPAADSISHMGNYDKAGSTDSQVKGFIHNLKKMTPGTWIFVEHPAYDQPEMQGVFHTGYENVGKDRDNVTRILLSRKVKKVIADKNIKLISYKDL
jgi:hypothetical protein